MKKKQTLVDYIKSFVEDSKTRIRPFIVTGELNQYYIMGKQHRKIDPETKTIQKKNRPKGIYLEQKTVNRMLPIYLTRNGILSDNKPIPGFKPAHGDPVGAAAAIEGNRFLTELLKEIDYDGKYKEMIEEVDVFPLGWVKTGIDWSKGDKISEEDVTVVQKDGTSVKKTINKNEGRVFMDVCSLYEVFPDSVKVSDGSKLRELVHRKPFHIDFINKLYGIEAEAELIEPAYIQKGMLVRDNDSIFEDHAYVYEYYRVPDAMYPEGRFVIMINDTIIKSKPLPFKNGSNGERLIPFDPIRLQSVTGYLPGITTYSQLIDIQDTYNAIYNRSLEYFNRLGIGRRYVNKGSLVDESNFQTKPGTVTFLTRFGRPPVNEQIDKIGTEMFSMLDRLDINMLNVAGLSQLTVQGMGGSHMRTDGVVDKIAESDTNKLSNALKNISTSLVQVMRKLIYLEKERQEILTKIFSVEKLDEFVIKYKLKDIDPDEVVIVNREFLMQSDQVIEKKTQQATAMGLYNPQVRMPYRAKLGMLDMLQASYLRSTLDPMEEAQFNRIQMEHFNLFNKETVEVKSYDDHAMHNEEHKILLMSSELEALRKNDNALYDFIVQHLEEHIQEHTQRMNQAKDQGVYDNAKAYLQ